MSENGGQTGKRAGLKIFKKADAPGLHETPMMSFPVSTPDPGDKLIECGTSGGNVVKVLFGDPESGQGMSLVWSWFGPNHILPRHSHSADCLYFVHRGEIRLGNHTLGEGDGFFVPADGPYAYTAGPDGVEVLEFRGVSHFDMKITESLARWDQIMASVEENRDRWAADAPT